MSRLRVLMLNYEYPPLGGGAGRANAAILGAFCDHTDIEIDLVASSATNTQLLSLAPHIRLHLLNIHRTGPIHHQSLRDLLFFSARSYLYARQLCQTLPYDLCHAFFGLPCGLIAQQLGIPYIVSLRGSDVPFHNPRFQLLDRLVLQKLSFHVWKHAFAVVGNSHKFTESARQQAPWRSYLTIPNGIDCERFAPPTHSTNRPTNAPLRVLCVSRLSHTKQITDLVEAARFFEKGQIAITLAGTGSHEAELRKQAEQIHRKEEIHFAGHLDQSALLQLYQQSDIFVLPSINEGMSNAVLEAMACGLPVLLTDTGGTKELLEEGGNGFLIQKNEPRSIAQQLRKYQEAPELLQEHGTRSRNKALSMSWKTVAEQYLALYEELQATKDQTASSSVSNKATRY